MQACILVFTNVVYMLSGTASGHLQGVMASNLTSAEGSHMLCAEQKVLVFVATQVIVNEVRLLPVRDALAVQVDQAVQQWLHDHLHC